RPHDLDCHAPPVHGTPIGSYRFVKRWVYRGARNGSRATGRRRIVRAALPGCRTRAQAANRKIMNRKKIILLGFMGGCPISGVVWQHIHYIVGFQRLGHEIYYVEDTSNSPYNPITLENSDNFTYAVQTLGKLASQYGFEGRWAYCARYKKPFAITGMERETLL